MMEASATARRPSENSFNNYDDSLSSPNSRYRLSDDVLSLSSWSEFEKLEVSDSPKRDGSAVDYSSHRTSLTARKNSRRGSRDANKSSDLKNVSRRVVGKSRSGSSLYSQDEIESEQEHAFPVSPNYSSNFVASDVFRRQSFSRENGGTCATVHGHFSPDFSYDIMTDQPDCSYIGSRLLGDADDSSRFRSNGLPRTSPKSRSTRKERPFDGNQHRLYPVLDTERQRDSVSCDRPDSPNPDTQESASSLYPSDFLDGPVSMPSTGSSVDMEDRTPFRSLPVATSASHSQPSTRKTPSEVPNYMESQYKSNNTDKSNQGPSSSLWRSQPLLSKAPALKRQPKSSNDLEALRDSFEHRLEHDNVKAKVMSVWNNFKYGWTFPTKPSIKYDSPLFMLGKCYHRRKNDVNNEPENEFMKDFTSRIWMTYRSNFYPIPGTKLNTDCGWGCMLRSAQMLITQCLVTHFLGRDWRIHDPQTETQQTFYREIIRWFSDPVDAPSDKMPFSLHHLVSFGRNYHKEPGQWFGPSSAAYIFRDAFARASQTLPILSQLCVYVAQDCTVYLDDVTRLCTARDKSENWANSVDGDSYHSESARARTGTGGDVWLRSLIILVPMRLGGEVMNEVYTPCVKNLLSQDSCMGIIGGKPKHSLFFVGWQDNKLVYLDPHLCREAVDTTTKDFKIETYHCMTPRKLTIAKMDPSCTVGFYIKDAAEFRKFVQEVKEYVCPANQKGAYPLFIFAEGSHTETYQQQTHNGADRGRVKITHYHVDKNGQKQRTFSKDSEDFIIL